VDNLYSYPIDAFIPLDRKGDNYYSAISLFFIFIFFIEATPNLKTNIIHTPMVPRSHARITQFLDDKDSSSDDEEQEEEEEEEDRDEGKERTGPNKYGSPDQMQLKAPNFNALSTDDEDSVKPSNSSAPLLQPAQFEVGWSMPGAPSSSQQTTALFSQMNTRKAKTSQSPSLFTVRQKYKRHDYLLNYDM
jgi:hypothetical protein